MKSLFRKQLAFVFVVLFISGLFAVHAATNQVQFGGALTFRPAVITINQGDTVIWTDTGTIHNHTVTGPPSDPLCGGAIVTSCQWTFTNAGDFAYQCDTHAAFGMTGMVHVVAAPVIVPAVLTNLTLLGGGEAQFTVNSKASQTNLIQASTNLADTNWTTISTVFTNTDSFIVTDSNAPNFQLRFYRVVKP